MGLIQFGSNHTPSFEDPIAMLLACHGKIRRFLDELHLLPEHVAQHGWDAKAQESVKRISQYFKQAAPLHHQDEEDDLFPAYARIAPQEDLEAIATLTSMHTELERTWQQLQHHLQSQTQPVNIGLIDALTQAYQSHMQLEEPLFARAQAALQDAQLHQLGQNMANRRR